MAPIDRARSAANLMRTYPSRDWQAHWLGILEDPTSATAVRRIADEALRNLGHQVREPGSDDE